jgi:hypothetical protein
MAKEMERSHMIQGIKTYWGPILMGVLAAAVTWAVTESIYGTVASILGWALANLILREWHGRHRERSIKERLFIPLLGVMIMVSMVTMFMGEGYAGIRWSFFIGATFMGLWSYWVIRSEQMLNSTSRSPHLGEKLEAYDVARKRILATWVDDYFLNRDSEESIVSALHTTRLNKLFKVHEVVEALRVLRIARCPGCLYWRIQSQINEDAGNCHYCKDTHPTQRF